MSNRRKGADGERWFINHGIKKLFPKAHRNWHEQTAVGGVDINNTENFDMEVKVGKQCVIKKVRGWLDQVEGEGKKENLKVVLVKPEREKPYVIMPYSDWLEIIERYLL